VPPGTQVERLEDLDLRISSSDIRASLAAGSRPAEVPEAVVHYIEANGLYGTRAVSNSGDWGRN
jgi:nicotinic acid mononucleotide adenylyltransferase